MSYALHGAGLLNRALHLGRLHELGPAPARARGSRSTPTAATASSSIAGLRFDTGWNNAGKGPRWSDDMRPVGGYTSATRAV